MHDSLTDSMGRMEVDGICFCLAWGVVGDGEEREKNNEMKWDNKFYFIL